MLVAGNVSAAEISEVNITIAAPNAGDKITAASTTCSYISYNGPEDTEGHLVEYPCIQTTPAPTVTLGDNSYSIETGNGKAIWLKKLPSQATSTDVSEIDEEIHYYEASEVTVEEGKDYYVEVPIVVSNTSEDLFSSNVVVKVNGSTEGFESTLTPGVSSTRFIVYAKVTATAGKGANSGSSSSSSSTVTYTTLEGASQTFSTNSATNLTFRFDADYSKFEANGKVYVDDTLVDPSNYTSKSGSTIIAFNSAYVKKLANGKHTLTIDFGDGKASTEFTITGNPNTGDNILVYVAMLFVSCIGIILYRKKSIKE